MSATLEQMLAAHRTSRDPLTHETVCTCGWRGPMRLGDPIGAMLDGEEHMGAEVRAWLAGLAASDEVREAVSDTVPLGWTDRDPYRDVIEAADAAVEAFLRATGVESEEGR